MKRKELALQMYHRQCSRCGQKIDMNNSMTYLIKKPENGGSYRFENVAVLCNDCNKILNTTNEVSKIISSLHIYDYLIHKIKY
jgi:5-methylcytosine-specific restriction endonuclease McrA